MGFCGKIRLGHATVTRQTGIICIQEAPQVSRRRQIAAAIDSMGENGRNISETEVELVIEAKIPRRGLNRWRLLRVPVTNGAFLSGLRAIMAWQTGFLFRTMVILRGRAGKRGGVASFTLSRPARQMISMRKDQILAGDYAQTSRKEGGRDSQHESCLWNSVRADRADRSQCKDPTTPGP
jgi:hypothetical protein